MLALMLQIIAFVSLSLLCIIVCQDIDLKGFDDSILFKINWPGKDGNEVFDVPNVEKMTVMTENNEVYKCLIPLLKEKEKHHQEKYSGPHPLELLSPVFTQSSCTYRIETYWTYELCHGRHIRQYHEEREGKKVKLQEYYLGRWDILQQEKLRQQLENEEKTRLPDHVPVKKIDGLNMPYLQLNMTDGTLCDLSAKPRLTKVLYVCYAHGKHEIYSLKETSICEYEVIVLSPVLCTHPRYRPQESGENIINCHPLEDAPKKPKNLLQLEAESLKLRHTKANDDKMQKVFAVFSVDKVAGQDGTSRIRVEVHPVEIPEDADSNTPPALPFAMDPASFSDEDSFYNFLSGKDCIQGGSGWWKYEFCYGKSVTQYHVEKDGSKTVVNLGNFIKSGHLEWLEANPHKRPKPLIVRKHISHFYTGGYICDKTGKPRQTEVKLKCLENKPNQGAVSLYLLEPKTCQYILGVESQLICRLLSKVDENGLYSVDEDVGFSRADYSTGYRPIDQYEDTDSEKDDDDDDDKTDGKKKEFNKITLMVDDADDLENHIPDGDE